MSDRRKRRATPVAVPGIIIEVKALTNFAFMAGLTAAAAEHILVESTQWLYPSWRCSLECGTQPHVVVDDAWDGRTLLYCTSCGVADLWV